jgi:hypothetical protein
MPSGKPEEEWEGIPIMPDAIAGEEDAANYIFTIEATPEEIQAFYEQKMSRLGWNLLGSGQGTTDALLLIFIKDAATFSIAVIPQPDGIALVMLVK